MQNESPYDLAREFALTTNRSIFLTGKAGTGKTTFLRKLQQETKKQMAIVAPTGVAAINAGGTTIHSMFQLPFNPFVPTPEARKGLVEKIKMAGYKRKVIQELELLVIDEISMVRADVLDAVDTVLRHFRYRYNEPFGGVQLILIGDMFQLSPVAVDDEWRLLSRYYQSPYFFHSKVIAEQKPVYIELDKIFRQQNATFIQTLNEVRNNCLSQSGLQTLMSRYNPHFVTENNDTYITLTTHNYKADQINNVELAKIKSKNYKSEARITGDFQEKSYPTEKVLELKVGAKVMFIRNDNENPRRFYNGKIGTIEKMNDDTIEIHCPEDKSDIEVGRFVWENIRYSTNEKTKQIEEEVVGTFTQFPLRLAWAITIHKSQGLTFDKAVIDAGDAFAAGQVYVALSRCRTLEGMVLKSRINPQSIENDRQIVEHQKIKPSYDELEQQLDVARNEFRQFVLTQLFEFRPGIGHVSRLIASVKEVENSFSEDTLPFLQDLLRQTQAIQEVAGKFQHQLSGIANDKTLSVDYLAERLDAATAYFREKISHLLDTINESPASTDSRDNARDYNDQLRSAFGYFAQKNHIFKGMKHPFLVEDYFVLKNTFLLPDFRPNAYNKTKETKAFDVKNKSLYFELLEMRNQICEPRDLPIYLVAGSQTLGEMADYLPQNEKDLLRINGFGPAKVEKYGELFLNIIRKYCKANNLESKMEMLATEKRIRKDKKEPKEKPERTEKKEKPEKGSTYRLTYQMYKEGKSIDEIATERGLVPGTIASHLMRYVTAGLLNINEFISEEKRAKAQRLLETTEEIGSVYQTLNTILQPSETTFFLGWIRAKNTKKAEE
ncbi:MAG: AAA family ATPase [Paludibacteraceae bacterium]|nr:AAA family ATPase [Paludibacteraceae bacterium]